MATATAHEQLHRARRTAMASPYRIIEDAEGFTVEEPHSGLSRWRQLAWFLRREEMEAFLTAMLPPPRDHG